MSRSSLTEQTRNTGKSDPYVIFRIGGKVQKSKVKKKSLNPEWNETLMPFNVPSSTMKLEVTAGVTLGCRAALSFIQPVVQLVCMDWDRVGADDYIGTGEVEMAGLVDGNERTVRVPLQNKEGRGALYLSLTFTLL